MLVTDDGAALNAAAVAEPTLRVVGALRRGALYESTAVPELRDQAADIARGLSAMQPAVSRSR